MKKTIRISEIFGPTIQGEGPLIGRPTVFVRTGGCDYRCTWCDTLYAVLPQYRDEWMLMSPDDIMARIGELSNGTPLLVSLSGGNPALQPLAPLIARGRGAGYRFAMETQGSIAQPWFADLDIVVLSPKPPSAGVVDDPGALDACLKAAGRSRCALKIVVFDDRDYTYARNMAGRFPDLPLYLQVGNPSPLGATEPSSSAPTDTEGLLRRFRWLAEKVIADRWLTATVLPQMHVLAWGNKRGI